MEIINQIEQLSAVTVPAIEVYPLKYVDSEALARCLRGFISQVLGPRIGEVSITPLGKPNALLLVGRAENVRMAIELVQKLDQPVPATTRFEVFPLKNASASEAKTMIDSFLEREAAGRDRGSADARTAGAGRGRRADQFAGRRAPGRAIWPKSPPWSSGSTRPAARRSTRCGCFRSSTPRPPSWPRCFATQFRRNRRRPPRAGTRRRRHDHRRTADLRPGIHDHWSVDARDSQGGCVDRRPSHRRPAGQRPGRDRAGRQHESDRRTDRAARPGARRGGGAQGVHHRQRRRGEPHGNVTYFVCRARRAARCRGRRRGGRGAGPRSVFVRRADQ